MTAPSEPEEQPASIRMGTRFDRLAAIFALGLSIAALLVSLVEVSAVRTQQRATAWPYVEISNSYSDAGFKMELTNKGVGPALMSDITLMHQGNRIEDLNQFIKDVLGPEKAFSYDLYRSSDPSNTVVAPGETVNLFSVPWEPRTREFVRGWGGAIDIETCYCSIHDDCWSVSLKSQSTQKTNKCETGISS